MAHTPIDLASWKSAVEGRKLTRAVLGIDLITFDGYP